MMNAKFASALVTAALLLGVVLLLPTTARGQPTDVSVSNAGTAACVPTGFIISNADEVTCVTTETSPTLNTLIGGVTPRFVVQYANGLRYYNLPPISSTLTSLMAQVDDRFVIQYANADRFYSFTYPVAMIGDTEPPLIATPPGVLFGPRSATITWFTNEFATTIFKYGVQTGVYTQTITDTLFYKLHEFTLTSLTPGHRYYYQVTHTDRSGNVFQSAEYNFVAMVSVYLPLVRK